jgi:hypothetical protein
MLFQYYIGGMSRLDIFYTNLHSFTCCHWGCAHQSGATCASTEAKHRNFVWIASKCPNILLHIFQSRNLVTNAEIALKAKWDSSELIWTIKIPGNCRLPVVAKPEKDTAMGLSLFLGPPILNE